MIFFFTLPDCRWQETEQIFGVTGIIGQFSITSADMKRDIAEHLLDEIHQGQPMGCDDAERDGEQVEWNRRDGYRFVFQNRDNVADKSRKLPQSLLNAPYITYRCSQNKWRPCKSRDRPFHEQRNKQSMEYVNCGGSLTFYFPPNGRVTFQDGCAEVFIELKHHFHDGRTNHWGVPKRVREWIRDNLRDTARIQRDDALRAIKNGTIPGFDLTEEQVYLSVAHVRYWWRKFREEAGRISDDPWVNMQHALSGDPKVSVYHLEVLMRRTQESFSMQSLALI